MKDHFNNKPPIQESFTTQHPVDYLEPLQSNDYRECAKIFLNHLTTIFAYLISQQDPAKAIYGAIYALGLPLCEDSMNKTAKKMGISVASISKHAQKIRLLTGLDPSHLQMSVGKTKIYKINREDYLEKNAR